MASDEGGKASKDVSQLVHTSAAFVNDAELAAAAGDKRGCVDLTPEAACSKVARPRVHDSPDYRQLDELVMALRGQLEQAKCTISANNRELNSLRAERDLLKLELQALRTAPVASMANSAARSQERQSAMQANNGGGAAAPGGGSSNCKNKQTGTHSSVIVLDSDGETEQPAEEVNDDDASMHTSGDASSLDNPRARSQVDAEGEGEEKEMSESGAKTTEDEELVFISSSGELGGDLPHPRNLCPRWKFFPVGDSIEKVPADKEEANRKCCKNCYCFLCDVNSSECRRWSTGNRSWLSHCNAHAGVKVCKELRSVFRHGLAVSPRIEDVLRPNCMKLGVEELLKVHRSFESFKRGHENMAWDDRRKKTYVVKEHTLHLGSALQGLSSALGVQLDAQLIVKHGDAQQPFETGVRLIEVTQHIYQIDLLLGTVLSFTFAREGFSAQEVSVQNAWDQYLRCVRSLNFLLSVALLVVAMHGSVPAGASGQEVSTKVQWSDVKEAMQERLTQFIQHIRDSRETFCGEYYCKLLEDTFAVPLAACTRGWSPDSGLDVGETGRTELRQAGLKALLAAGSQADLEAFVNKTENRDLMSLCFITGMVSRGLFDAACDAVLALAPENASSRSRSWLTTAQFYDLWNRFWCANVAAGIRFGLRAALGDALPHRPDNDRFDPGFSARCTILKKVISELCKRREGENEAAAWQQAWTRVTTTDQLQSIAAIRTTACQVLDEAGCKWPRPAAYDGTQLRKGLLSHCADGAVASPHGRLLFVEVCIEAFSRMHGGHQDPRLCTELERMSTFLVNSLNVGGLISLVNSLHPKPLHSGGQVWRRRRDLLSELLKLADSTPSSRVPVAPPADANERCSTVGMGGWVPDKAMSVPDSSKLVLTVALEPDTLADLRSDDLSGTTAVNAAVARFCLRQAHEGRCEEALWQARSLLECAEGNKGGSKKGRIAPALCDTFWAYIFEVIPYAETAGNKGLLSDLVIACARRVPCAATAVALAQHPPEKVSILEMHKFVAAGTGLSSQPFALAFGCYSVLGFKESAIKELSNACRRLPKAVIFCEAETIIRALGPLALESSPLASGEGFTGAGTCHSSTWIASIVETIMAKFTGCRGLLEMETALLGILQVAVQIEPGAILPTLQEQVEQVVIKITRETAKKLSAERMHEIRSQFVDWMSALKQIYHTRPAVVAENVRKIWERVRIPHTRRTWPAGENGGVATQESDMPRSLYRVRGPSLSSEWESVVSDLKNRVGRKASIWRDVKAAGIAQ